MSKPLPGVAPYVGGKRVLASRVIARIEAVPHKIYVEPFVGMGGVFFRRRTRARSEVINDLSSDVATLFRVPPECSARLISRRWQRCSARSRDVS